MDAREKIRAVLLDAWAEGGSDTDSGEWKYRPEDDTDRIIAIVREALLSEDMIRALSQGKYPAMYRMILNDAVNTAFGAEPRQEEER